MGDLMHKSIRNIILLADIADGILPQNLDCTNDDTLASLISDIIRRGIFINSDEDIQKYSLKLCELFENGERFSKIVELILRLNKRNFNSDLEPNEAISIWREILDTYYSNEKNLGYDSFSYIGDIIKIRYLNVCYFDIINHTKEIRSIASELQDTKIEFNKYEQSLRNV